MAHVLPLARVMMRGPAQVFLASVAILGATVASGTLECQPDLEPRSVAHGRDLYGRMCSVCHGANGEGYKADQAPALAQADFLRTVTDSYLRTAIVSGRAGSTMSAWGIEHGGPLGPKDVSAVIEFLRTWQTEPSAVLDERPLEGDVARGTTIFAISCASCHGARGLEGKFVSIGNPQILKSASNGFLRAAILNGRPGTAMPAFGQTLGPQGADDVLAYLRAAPEPPASRSPHFTPPPRPPPLPLGQVPLHPNGPEPVGFLATPAFTSADVIASELARGARFGILDARAPSDYVQTHIQGAVSVPFYDPDPYVSFLPKDAWLVCYCGCPHAESGQLAQKLRAKGFTKVTVLDEGLRVWQAKKYATQTGQLP